METDNIILKELSKQEIKDILIFAKKLNPEKTDEALSQYILDMFVFKNYTCFGLFYKELKV